MIMPPTVDELPSIRGMWSEFLGVWRPQHSVLIVDPSMCDLEIDEPCDVNSRMHVSVSFWNPSHYPYSKQYKMSFCRQSVDFLILAQLWLSKTGQIGGFGAFSGERMQGMVWNLVTTCWFFLHLAHLTNWDKLHIRTRTHRGNGWKCGTSIYSDHVQNWWDCSHCLSIFLI